jgi:signal transduction histidine kinase
MNSITTRLTAISGKITFEQRTNGGTIVTIQVPLT